MDTVVKTNPNKSFLSAIIQALAENEGYCPCQLVKNEDTECMCKDFRDQTRTGFCHCGRYYKLNKFPVVTLCGSTKFKKDFELVRQAMTLEGAVILAPELYKHWDNIELTEEEIDRINLVHYQKIEMADIVFIINKGGYIGEQTRKEIEWATELNKKIVYLEDKGE